LQGVLNNFGFIASWDHHRDFVMGLLAIGFINNI